jgi:hypothetical protein
MRKRILAGAALAAVATLVATGGAGAGSATTGGLDLRDTAAVDSYLRSIGIDPATVVRQSGLLNYAGPNCPGPGWNCTTSSRVVQLAQPGGTNVFESSSDNNQNNDCELTMQDGMGGQNKIHCKMRSTMEPIASQEFTIMQFNAKRNLAIVDFDIQQGNGPTQTATQYVRVEQTATEKNDVQIKESVKQSTRIATTLGGQKQEIQQVAIVDQTASGSDNFAHVHQNQDQRESGAATDQDQNTGVAAPNDLADCASGTSNNKTDPNACAYFDQTSDGGKNEAHLHQNINQDQSTNATLAASQEQGSPSTNNGIEGEIDQMNPDGVGSNLKHAHQDHRQRQSGPSGTTSQRQDIDPGCCGVGTTVGGADNIDDFNQTAIQSASEGDNADQSLFITGDTNHVGGESLLALSSSSPSRDRCTITHKAANNEDSTHGTVRREPCGVLVVETFCENTGPYYEGEIVEGCFGPQEVGGGLTSLSTVFSLPSTPTLGLPIQLPNFGEPSSFPGPIFTGI